MGGRGTLAYTKKRLTPSNPNIKGNTKGGKARPIDISKIKDQSLEGIERRIRSLDHEELFVFDKDGKLIAGYMGGPHSVSFPVITLLEDGATVTHGHPKGSEEFGGTFSFADMENMLNSNWAEHRATASGQGEMNYILRRTEKSDWQGAIKQINKDIRAGLNQRWQDVYDQAYKEAIRAGKPEKEARHLARQKGVGVLNKYWADTLPKYGYEYITRKEDYRYGR